MSLNVAVRGQGHQGHKRHRSALAAACVQFILLKHLWPLVVAALVLEENLWG